MWCFPGPWSWPWPDTGCSSNNLNVARWSHHISGIEERNCKTQHWPCQPLFAWIRLITIFKITDTPKTTLWSQNQTWSEKGQRYFVRLTVAQCNFRDFWCILLICTSVASCTTPFSSTLISKGCWKSPTDTKENNKLKKKTQYQNNMSTSKTIQEATGQPIIISKSCCRTVAVFRLHHTCEP